MSTQLITLAQKVGSHLKQQGSLLAVAESCTGGGLGYYITSIDGSSDWFERGFITYSNAAKMELLGVKPITLETYGAVSEETAREMAEGALQHSHATVSIAITGIAGPTGGSTQKPVGTVWVAWAKQHDETRVTLYMFKGDRQSIREQAIEQALNGLLLR